MFFSPITALLSSNMSPCSGRRREERERPALGVQREKEREEEGAALEVERGRRGRRRGRRGSSSEVE